MQVILGIVAVVIVVWLGYFVLGVMGQFCILVLDTIARGFGVNDPVLGWILVGVVFGAIVGLRYGFRRAGAPLSTTRSALMLAIPVILLGSIGAARSSPPSSPSSSSSRENTEFKPVRQVVDNREAVTISADGMNLRSKPTTHSAVVATLHANSLLTLLETSDDWSHVADRSSSPRYTGWIRSKYLRPLPDAAAAANRPGGKTSQMMPGSAPTIPAAERATATGEVVADTAVAPRNCYQAEGISCTIVPEQEQQPIQQAFNASLDAINQKDIARAQASVSRANQLLDPWLQRLPSDPWVARTSRHLNVISSDIQTVCNSASRSGERLKGC
ncbi:MAG: SH3 domain-containing protein [Gemmatimonadaceae bacterium]